MMDATAVQTLHALEKAATAASAHGMEGVNALRHLEVSAGYALQGDEVDHDEAINVMTDFTDALTAFQAAVAALKAAAT
jgi:hypothetical protein